MNDFRPRHKATILAYYLYRSIDWQFNPNSNAYEVTPGHQLQRSVPTRHFINTPHIVYLYKLHIQLLPIHCYYTQSLQHTAKQETDLENKMLMHKITKLSSRTKPAYRPFFSSSSDIVKPYAHLRVHTRNSLLIPTIVLPSSCILCKQRERLLLQPGILAHVRVTGSLSTVSETQGCVFAEEVPYCMA